MRCKQTASFKDQHGYEHYHNCDFKVYCTATYRSGTTGEFVTRDYCKKHYNALVKNIARVQRLTGWDFELTIKLIT